MKQLQLRAKWQCHDDDCTQGTITLSAPDATPAPPKCNFHKPARAMALVSSAVLEVELPDAPPRGEVAAP